MIRSTAADPALSQNREIKSEKGEATVRSMGAMSGC
jgi:hypothetical protein